MTDNELLALADLSGMSWYPHDPRSMDEEFLRWLQFSIQLEQLKKSKIPVDKT